MADGTNGPSAAELGLTQQDLGVKTSIEPARSTPSFREELIALSEQSKDFEILYHQTRRSLEASVMSDGLKARRPQLDNTTLPLFDKPFESLSAEAQEEFMVGLRTYHLGSGRIGTHRNEERSGIIIMIPKIEGHNRDNWYQTPYNQVFQTNSQEDRDKFPYVIPANYVWGSIRVEQEQVVRNPNFKPEPLKLVKPA